MMPLRKIPLVNNQVYHVFNRSVGNIPIFKGIREYKRFSFSMFYYQNAKPPMKLSKFNTLSIKKRRKIISSLQEKRDLLVHIISYCLMPNHFHFVIKQISDDGIKIYLRVLTNSYSHYFNTKNDRFGALFGGRFKAVRIENDEQLLHVVRYVHLNPYTSYVVDDLKHLEEYYFSSFPEYLGKTKNEVCHKQLVLTQFRNIKKYKDFVYNQADYQRSLERIKHKMLD